MMAFKMGLNVDILYVRRQIFIIKRVHGYRGLTSLHENLKKQSDYNSKRADFDDVDTFIIPN